MLSRELCYYLYGPSSFWPNPFRGVWHSARALYACEWTGHWGFNWHALFSWISNGWQSIAASLGSMGGVYAIWRTIKKSFKPPKENQQYTTQMDPNMINSIFDTSSTFTPLASRQMATNPLHQEEEEEEEEENKRKRRKRRK